MELNVLRGSIVQGVPITPYRVPLALSQQGAATRRAQTVAPGNTPQRVGRRLRARARRARQTPTRPREAMRPRTVSATQGLRATALGHVRRVPLARTRQGAATRRAQTVAPGNIWPVKAEMRRQTACCAERASTRPRLGRRRQPRALIAGRANTLQLKETLLSQIVYLVGWALTRPRLGRRRQPRAWIAGRANTWQVKAGTRRLIVSFVQKGSSQP